MNPLQLIQMIKSGQNPQQLVMNMLQNNAQNNPLAANLLHLAQNNDSSAIETFARNYFASQGKDFDKEFEAFRNTYKL